MPSPDDLTAPERRALLEMHAELSAVDPDEHKAGSPYHVLLLGTEITALRKVLADVFVNGKDG